MGVKKISNDTIQGNVNRIEYVKLLDSDLEKCVLSGVLSRATAFTLHVKGIYGPKEIGNLIRMLEFHLDWLAPDVVDGATTESG